MGIGGRLAKKNHLSQWQVHDLATTLQSQNEELSIEKGGASIYSPGKHYCKKPVARKRTEKVPRRLRRALKLIFERVYFPGSHPTPMLLTRRGKPADHQHFPVAVAVQLDQAMFTASRLTMRTNPLVCRGSSMPLDI